MACAHARISATASRRFGSSSPARKKIPLNPSGKSKVKLVPSCPGKRGVGHRHERWGRLRWTRQRQARGSDRRAVLTVSEHGAQTNGADAYGKTVWSWHPLLVSSRRRFAKSNRASCAVNSLATVTRRIRRRGERGISRKTIAQGMPDCSDCTCMLVCVSLCAYCTRDRGCSKHPAFPAPSDFRG